MTVAKYAAVSLTPVPNLPLVLLMLVVRLDLQFANISANFQKI
jgi:hypothetical protein